MTQVITNDEKITILHRTLDWLEAHPERAIRGAMAKDAEGDHCLPFDPEATCFCFVGRLSVEADLRGQVSGDFKLDVQEWLEPLNVTRGGLQSRNDSYFDQGIRFKALRSYIEQTTERRSGEEA